MTTSQKEIIDAACGGVPTSYDRKSAPKQKINNCELWKSDVRTFGSSIGLITNVGTFYFSKQKEYKKGSLEYNVIENRLKVCCALQSAEIDRGKGIESLALPKHWTDWTKITDDMPKYVQELCSFNNRLVATQRPYFMRHVYPSYDKEYVNHNTVYDNYSINRFGLHMKELIEKQDKTELEQEHIDFYYRYGNLLDNDSVMNYLCKYMESSIKEMKRYTNDFGWEFNVEDSKYEQMKEIYHIWKNKVRRFDNETNEIANNEISRIADVLGYSDKELARLSLSVNSSFAFSCFLENIVSLFEKDVVLIPVLDSEGEHEYLYQKYSLMEVKIEKEEQRH